MEKIKLPVARLSADKFERRHEVTKYFCSTADGWLHVLATHRISLVIHDDSRPKSFTSGDEPSFSVRSIDWCHVAEIKMRNLWLYLLHASNQMSIKQRS